MDGLENLNRLVTQAVEKVRKAERNGERAERTGNGNGNGRSRLTRLTARKPR